VACQSGKNGGEKIICKGWGGGGRSWQEGGGQRIISGYVFLDLRNNEYKYKAPTERKGGKTWGRAQLVKIMMEKDLQNRIVTSDQVGTIG